MVSVSVDAQWVPSVRLSKHEIRTHATARSDTSKDKDLRSLDLAAGMAAVSARPASLAKTTTPQRTDDLIV
ncbi:hypothetical protein ES703_51181 [subsurface metagenome]